jgi:putative ABC transport system ATP-binding protein
LTIARGEALALVGRSGSGKSTLLRILGGLESADSGSVVIGEHDLAALSETARARHRRRHLGFVFQFFNLIPTLTVRENVELPLALNGMAARDSAKRSESLLRELGLASSSSARFPDELSGGEQQRVAIARALVHEPALVLADEPTGNLDAVTASQVLQLLRSTCHSRGATLVMATHSTDAAAKTDRVVTILDGQLAAATAS